MVRVTKSIYRPGSTGVPYGTIGTVRANRTDSNSDMHTILRLVVRKTRPLREAEL